MRKFVVTLLLTMMLLIPTMGSASQADAHTGWHESRICQSGRLYSFNYYAIQVGTGINSYHKVTGSSYTYPMLGYCGWL